MRAGIGPAVGLLALLVFSPLPASANATGDVRGRVSIAVDGVEASNVGPVAVYLSSVNEKFRFDTPQRRVTIRQENAQFVPSFSVVTVGQTIDLPNNDGFLHNVFSFSKPNDFELGLYPAGESRSVTLNHPGVVRIYCSIHESMRAVVLVAPSPWHAIGDASGAFEILDVPPGDYQITTFNEPLPSETRDLKVVAGESTIVKIAIGAKE